MYYARHIAPAGSLRQATKAFDKIGATADHLNTTATEGQVVGSLVPVQGS